MSIVKYSAARPRLSARVRRKIVARTTETDIARHAAEDATATDSMDLGTALKQGALRIVEPLDVAAIRGKTGLSQESFARAFRISPHTLRNWEQGRRVPEGPARALLMAIERDPKAVMQALRE